MKELELNVRSVTNLEHMHTSITGDDCHVLLPISDFFFLFPCPHLEGFLH